MPKKFLILGPEDQDQLPMFWSREKWDWVERDEATLYGKEIWLFPPRELPVGAQGVLDVMNGQIHTPKTLP